MSPSESHLDGAVFGKFRLVRKIGEGGMGTVYLAERVEDFEQTVALKVLLEGLHTESVLARFRVEQQALAALQHPNIVQIVDSGVSEKGFPYIAMEYVEGMPIDAWCNEKRLSLDERLQLFLQVLDAADYAHRRFLIHCDLKPSNILVAEDGNARLLDFGVAKLLQPEAFGAGEALTNATLRPFTPDYASPEQLKSELLTTAADVYSGGVVLHQLLCGHIPFEDLCEDPVKRLRAVCGTDPELPSRRAAALARQRPEEAEKIAAERSTSPEALASKLRGDLDAIIAKALRTDPAQRYSSATAFAEDIRNYLAHRPVAARPLTLSYRLTRFAARNRLAVGACAAIAVVLLGFLGSWLTQFWRTQRSHAQATARFADVRQITNTLLFDFYDTVAQLPGATPAQESLVTWSLRYLDELSRRESADPALRLELAEGYRKLGDLLGNPYMNNLGKPDQAVETLTKGLVLIDAPAEASDASAQVPESRDGKLLMARIYRSRSQIRWLAGQSDLCIRDADESLRLFKDLARRYPNDYEIQMETAAKHETHADLYAGAYWVVADTSLARQLLEEAETYARRAIAADPSQVRPYRALAIFRMKIADILADIDPAASIPVFEEGLRLLDAVPEHGQKEAATQRVRRVIVFRAAWSYSAIGKYDDAIRMYDSVLAEHEEAVRLDPANEQTHWDLAVLLKQSAEARLYGGRLEEALADYTRCVKVIRDFYQDNLDGERRAALGETLVYQGIALARLGRQDEAIPATREGLAILRKEASDPELSAATLQRAARCYLIALPESLQMPRQALALLDQRTDEDRDEDSIYLGLRAKALAGLGKVDEAVALARKAMSLSSEQENVNEWKRLQEIVALR